MKILPEQKLHHDHANLQICKSANLRLPEKVGQESRNGDCVFFNILFFWQTRKLILMGVFSECKSHPRLRSPPVSSPKKYSISDFYSEYVALSIYALSSDQTLDSCDPPKVIITWMCPKWFEIVLNNSATYSDFLFEKKNFC